MSDDYEPLHDPETGEHIGWMLQAADGAFIGTDLDGEIVSAADPETGEELDPAGYAWADEEPQQEPLDERIAALEARLDEPVQPYTFEMEPLSELDEARTTEDMAEQAARVERQLGRSLTLAERRLIGERAVEDVLRTGRAVDLEQAMVDLASEGHEFADLDSGHRGRDHEARTEFMAAKLADAERLDAHERGEDDLSAAEPPATRDAYDLDDRADRTAYMLDRMRGATDTSATYSSSDHEEEA